VREAWEQTVAAAFPQRHAPGYAGYPLLGPERPEAEPRSLSRWQLRLALRDDLPALDLAALLEDVDQVRLSRPPAPGMALGDREVFLEQGPGDPAWSLLSRESAALGPLPGERLHWQRAERTSIEQVVLADGQILRNLALLRAAAEQHPEVDRWVVRSSLSAASEAEGLIGDTLAYWTAAVAGVHVLEVEQQPAEPFATLWSRLNVPRLLRWESELGEPGDALCGAGLFDSLAGFGSSMASPGF
jgi:hypothetical protein